MKTLARFGQNYTGRKTKATYEKHTALKECQTGPTCQWRRPHIAHDEAFWGCQSWNPIKGHYILEAVPTILNKHFLELLLYVHKQMFWINTWIQLRKANLCSSYAHLIEIAIMELRNSLKRFTYSSTCQNHCLFYNRKYIQFRDHLQYYQPLQDNPYDCCST